MFKVFTYGHTTVWCDRDNQFWIYIQNVKSQTSYPTLTQAINVAVGKEEQLMEGRQLLQLL